MIELRWRLNDNVPDDLREGAIMENHTLQYRIHELTPDMGGWFWSEWKDVPFVDEKK